MTTTTKQRCQVIINLNRLNIGYDDAQALRRISMTLGNWYALECGDGNDHCSWAIERDEETEKPYRVTHYHQGPPKPHRYPIADREKGALRRLAALMGRYPELTYYVQTDPRGASLYVIPKASVNGTPLDQVYSSIGVAVF